jgi:haloalkane dehalogenase
LTEHIHQHYIKPLQKPEERKGCSILPGQILGATDWLAELWERKSVLVEIPKLVVWGMKDIAFRENELNVWAAAYPDLKVVRLENVGHYVQEEGGNDLLEAVRHFMNS